MREYLRDHIRLLNPCPEPVEGIAMSFKLPLHGQRSISMANTRFNRRAQLMRKGGGAPREGDKRQSIQHQLPTDEPPPCDHCRHRNQRGRNSECIARTNQRRQRATADSAKQCRNLRDGSDAAVYARHQIA